MSADDAVEGTGARIAGLGAYVPRYRLGSDELASAWGRSGAAGIQTTAVPAADEDVLTMAFEAAEAALAAADVDAAGLESIVLGTTTPTLAEEATTARLASFLGVTDATTTQLTGSTAAGVDALRIGLEEVSGGEDAVVESNAAAGGEDAGGPTLVVASDAPRGAPDSDVEHAAGAGAAAAVLTQDGSGAVLELASRTESRPGTRFRPTGDRETRGLGITQYDRDAFTETLGSVAEALEFGGDELDAAAIQAPDGKLPYRAASALGVETDQIQAGTTVHEHGDTGAASPLLGLVAAVDDGAGRVLCAGYGSGAEATVVVLDVENVPVDGRLDGSGTVTYAEYLRLRGEITPGEPDGGGAYVSVPSWRRTLPQRHRLEAGRCRECGSVNLPPEGACDDCHALAEYEPVTLPGTGTVEAVTEIGQGGAPPEFLEQQARSGAFASAVVALDGPGGGSASLPMQVIGDGEPDIGDRVETTIRRIYTQEALPRYGRKAMVATSDR